MAGEPERGSGTKPMVRWFLFPMALGWLAVFVSAPFALMNEAIAGVALVVGIAAGLVIAVANPRIFQSSDSASSDSDTSGRKPLREVGTGVKLVLTGIAILFAYLVWYATNSTGEKRGILFFLVAFVMISAVRKLLRRAWGMPGSLAGMASSGALLFMLLRSSTEGEPKQMMLVAAVAVPLVLLEAWEERRGIQRMQAAQESA